MADVVAQPTLGTFVHQEHDFRASPKRVYEALLDEEQFAAFSGAPAEIQRAAGGSFSLIRGRVTGRNVELLANQRIVQAWRVVPWEPGIYSIVRFELIPKADGTRLVLDHSGFPPEDVAARHQGWQRVYFEPLRKYLEEQSK
jgi:activator of HSP90 ATPase